MPFANVRRMKTHNLRKELSGLRREFKQMANCERGGSPLEYLDERSDEIRTELSRRRKHKDR